MQVVASDRNEIAFRRAPSALRARHRRGDDRAPAWARRGEGLRHRLGAERCGRVDARAGAPSARRLSAEHPGAGIARRCNAASAPRACFGTCSTPRDYDRRLREEITNEKIALRHLADLERTLDVLEQWSDASLGASPRAKLNGFVNRMTLASAKMSEEQAGRVTLSTIHGVKGLEFERVWVVGIEEGSLPTQRSIDANEPAEIEEERRLCMSPSHAPETTSC